MHIGIHILGFINDYLIVTATRERTSSIESAYVTRCFDCAILIRIAFKIPHESLGISKEKTVLALLMIAYVPQQRHYTFARTRTA